jgi:hypothetical protein
MLIRRSLLAASLFWLALVSACTDPSKGDPQPVPPTENTTSSSAPRTSDNGEEELPFAGAPKVNDPLDTSRYQQDPCRSLTADQAQSLNLPPTGTINDKVALGIGCDWLNQETRGEVGIDFLVDDPRGLSPEYDANNRGEWKYFDELPDIEGYPAIARGDFDHRDTGFCTVLVGVADDMAFATSVQQSQANIGSREPCDVAAEVAGMALQTMKAGA